MQSALQRTPLYEQHVARGARMVPFAGWELPVQYDGVIPEHLAVRRDRDVFDTETPELLKQAPHNRPVRRLDEVKAAKEPIVKHTFDAAFGADHQSIGSNDALAAVSEAE